MSTSSPMPCCTDRTVAAFHRPGPSSQVGRTALGMLCGVLLAFIANSCRQGGAPAPRAVATPFTIFYTCDTRGNLHPCDCEGGREGGMPRRATYLQEASADGSLLVDAGNVTAGAREWQLLAFEYLLKAYEAMGYDAVNLGHTEAGLSADRLRTLGDRYPLLVSANVVDSRGEYVVSPYRIVRDVGDHRIAVVGVMDDSISRLGLGEGLRILPPDLAVGQVLPNLVGKADTIVLLAFADKETLSTLGNMFFEISVIVGGRVEQPSATPLRLNEALTVYITDQGKSIGRLDLAPAANGRWTGTNHITPLTDAFPDEPEFAALVAECDRRMAELLTPPPGSPDHGTEGLAPIRREPQSETAP